MEETAGKMRTSEGTWEGMGILAVEEVEEMGLAVAAYMVGNPFEVMVTEETGKVKISLN